jgi:hypothetical protein
LTRAIDARLQAHFNGKATTSSHELG